ncbi:hypothetical protein [Paraburkholderia lycopersici]|uniref:Uncharacterized protein n=1 Tax=Paraburkholderia lycopersici TaxID=416944 RepID=A0A1G6GV99_9BURK|nr:hypothetical protein [Paraburkholderia lycopersici]SDB85970.1 hypothetical protein SAMN05421548_101380 [Paraburkholderia lycopersici]
MNNIDSITNDTSVKNNDQRDAFADKFMKMAKQHGIFYTMTYDKDNFSIRVDGTHMKQNCNLNNVYAEYRAAYGKARDAILRNYLRGVKEALSSDVVLGAPFNKIRHRLRPLLRNRILTDNERYEFKGDDPSEFRPTPRKLFSSDANIVLGVDSHHTLMEVRQKHLESWGISFDDALDIAMNNLEAVSPIHFEGSREGVFRGGWLDYYDSSRLLLPDLFSRYGHFDDPVIVIPESGVIYITNKADKAAQLHMLNALQKHVNTTLKIVSTQMYHFVDGKPTEYKPEDNQLEFKLAEINKPLFQSYAQQQKKIVEDYLIETGNWAYFMSPMVVRAKEKDSIATVCCWSNDMECIFPEADIVTVTHVTSADEGTFHVHSDPVLMWCDVIEKYGHLLQKMEGFPNLYRAAPFANHQEATAMAA